MCIKRPCFEPRTVQQCGWPICASTPLINDLVPTSGAPSHYLRCNITLYLGHNIRVNGSFLRSRCADHRFEEPDGKRIRFARGIMKRTTARVHGVVQAGSQQHRVSVQDQVAALVKTSTSKERLSRMYEGWMAWM